MIEICVVSNAGILILMKRITRWVGVGFMVVGAIYAINISFLSVRLMLNDLGFSGFLYWIGILVAIILSPLVVPISFIMAFVNHPGAIGFSILYLLGSVVIVFVGFRAWSWSLE